MSIVRNSVLMAALSLAPLSAGWAQSPNPDLNPGNSGGGHEAIGYPQYDSSQPANPALTTGSRFSVTPNTPADENPTVPGATGMEIVKGDRSTISGDRRATIQQKTGGTAADAPG